MKVPDPLIQNLLPGYEEHSSKASVWLGWLSYIAILIFLIGEMPKSVLMPNSSAFILTLGGIGIWRYSWAIMHMTRAFYFKFIVFPRMRRQANAAALSVPYFYFVVTSFRMSAQMNAAVYSRLLDEIASTGTGATIVAGITDPADLSVLRHVFHQHPNAGDIVLLPIYQSGKGKRDILADALDLIAARQPLPDSQVVLMDGDTLLGEGCLSRASSIIQTNPDIGAVTTENIPLIKGSMLQREWYRLRMAQRNVLMSSLSLSRKVLVLTGRLSFFRAEIATRPEFILSVRSDIIRHWRLGRISLLTGDDKSTWYNVLKGGWNMLYVPDAIAHPLEELPPGGFFISGVALMSRWFGNMIRANGRALALGPQRTGWFLWVCLLDQRLSMWTSLVGPTFSTLLSVFLSPLFMVIYILWVCLTRGLMTFFIGLHSGRSHPLFLPLLYYSQVVGSIVKVFMSFHPYRQKWTRQHVSQKEKNYGLAVFNKLTSHIYNFAMILVFILFVVYIGKIAEQGDRQLSRVSGSDVIQWDGRNY